MMVTIAIGGILLAMAVGAWGDYRERTKVEAAKEKIVSVLQQARLKALSSGVDQNVIFDWANNTMTAFGVSTSFDVGVDIKGYKCTAPVASYDTNTSTFSFKRRGSVGFTTTLPSGNPQSLVVGSGSTSRLYFIKVRSITGRVASGDMVAGGTC